MVITDICGAKGSKKTRLDYRGGLNPQNYFTSQLINSVPLRYSLFKLLICGLRYHMEEDNPFD
jgi:hypothetical protein